MNENGNDGSDNTSELPYDLWVEESLRLVIYRALDYIHRHGLPGDHHCYITFRTNHPEVRIPGHLRAQHPDTMTIVLQYQFENLSVSEDGFDVTLRFGGKPEALSIPFEAVTAYHDPAVNFGLQLNVKDMVQALNEEDAYEDDEDTDMAIPDGNAMKAEPPLKPEEEKTGEVIALDQFRKK